MLHFVTVSRIRMTPHSGILAGGCWFYWTIKSRLIEHGTSLDHYGRYQLWIVSIGNLRPNTCKAMDTTKRNILWKKSCLTTTGSHQPPFDKHFSTTHAYISQFLGVLFGFLRPVRGLVRLSWKVLRERLVRNLYHPKCTPIHIFLSRKKRGGDLVLAFGCTVSFMMISLIQAAKAPFSVLYFLASKCNLL